MDELGLRTWRKAIRSGRINPAPLIVYWALLEHDWLARGERFDDALALGLDEPQARAAESRSLLVNVLDLARDSGSSVRRIHDNLSALAAVDAIAIADRDRGRGLYEIWVFHAPPASAEARPPDPQQKLPFATPPCNPDASTVDLHDRDQRPGHGQKAPTDQRPGATPTDQRPGATPTDQRPGATPTDQRPGATPTDQRPGATPTDQRPGATPTDQRPGRSPAIQSLQRPGQQAQDDRAGLHAHEPPQASLAAAVPTRGLPPHFSARGGFGTRTADVCQTSAEIVQEPPTPHGGNCTRTAAAEIVAIYPRAHSDESESDDDDVALLLEEQQASSSSVSERGAAVLVPKPPRPFLPRAEAICRRLDPDHLPWDRIHALVDGLTPSLRSPMSSGLDGRTAHLAIVATVAVHLFPELGEAWLTDAADLTRSFGRINRGGHFRVCLSEGLELAGIAAKGDGRFVLGRLQWLLSAAPNWYSKRYPPVRPKQSTPLAERRAAEDAEREAARASGLAATIADGGLAKRQKAMLAKLKGEQAP